MFQVAVSFKVKGDGAAVEMAEETAGGGRERTPLLSSAESSDSSVMSVPGDPRSPTAATRTKIGRNPAHKYFEGVVKDGVKRKICQFKDEKGKVCGADLGDHASTLQRHLEDQHLMDIKKMKAENKKEQEMLRNRNQTVNEIPSSSSTGGTPSVVAFLSEYRVPDSKKLSKNDKQLQSAHKCLALMIASSNLPVSMVEHPLFRRYTEILNPAATVPCRAKVSKSMKEIYADMMMKMELSLARARQVGVTSDMWTAKGNKYSLLSVTVHFVDPESKKLERLKIACRLFKGRHTGVQIAQCLKGIFVEKSIDKKIGGITCDNGANMLKAIRVMNEDEELDENDEDADVESDESDEDSEDFETLEEDFNEREASLNTALDSELYPRVPCYSHTSQLPLKKVEKQHKDRFCAPLVKAQKLVSLYRKSPLAHEVLAKTSFQKSLILSIDIRWFSRMFMAKRILEACSCTDAPLNFLITNMKWDLSLAISLGDIRNMELYVQLLEPLQEKSDSLGSEKKSTLQLVVPAVRENLLHIEQMIEKHRADTSFVDFAQDLHFQYKKRFAYALDQDDENFNPLFVTATYCDPILSEILSKEEKDVAKETLKNRVRDHLIRQELSTIGVVDRESRGLGEPRQKKRKGIKGFGLLSKEFIDKNQTPQGSTMFSRDLVKYTAEYTVLRSGGIMTKETEDIIAEDSEEESGEEEMMSIDDPLNYWLENSSKYESPIGLVAQDLLGRIQK